MRSIPVAVLLTTLLSVGAAHADRRAFTHTYEYQTMPQGGLDLELWNAQIRPKFGDAAMALELKLETEYGITDHWDTALYQIFTAGADRTVEPFNYAATSIESRYRFAERGEWPVDTLVYFEAVKPLGEDGVELEVKGIFARDFGSLTLALNLIAELVIGDSSTEFVPGWAFGASYEVVPSFKIGAETFGERSEDHEVRWWAGPALSWAPSPKMWIAGSATFGLTSASDDFIAQIVIGISI